MAPGMGEQRTETIALLEALKGIGLKRSADSAAAERQSEAVNGSPADSEQLLLDSQVPRSSATT